MMEIMEIFGLQFLLSTIGVALVARWYIAPRLSALPTAKALQLLLLPHMFRHLGLVFVVPALVGENLDPSFAAGAAYGDLASGLLAIVAALLLQAKWRGATAVVWLFNIVGTFDLVNALRQAEVVPDLGVAWLIPTFVVPVLLVTHVMIFVRLFRQRQVVAVEAR